MSKFRIGRHINISHGFLTAPAYARSINCDVMQIFLGAPQRIYSKAKPTEELRAFGTELVTYKLHVVIHGSYTINLCHQPTSKQFVSSVKALVQDLTAASVIGSRCLGVIIHM